jgi:hypothetical protein
MRLILASAMLLTAGRLAAAVDARAANDHPIRLGGELLAGVAGVEPGGFAEFSFGRDRVWQVRPEAFLNRDRDLGVGVALLWNLEAAALPPDHSLWLGPRIAFHNADDWGAEASALLVYNIPIPRHEMHNVEVLAALGVIDDKEDDRLTLAASVGAAYAYRF